MFPDLGARAAEPRGGGGSRVTLVPPILDLEHNLIS